MPTFGSIFTIGSGSSISGGNTPFWVIFPWANSIAQTASGAPTEYPVARYFRDAPTYAMVEGSANICKFIMAQDQLGIRKANR